MGKFSKKKKTQELPTSPGWMTTYGDLMTLLLTFFVLLFTFSSLNMAKFHAVLYSLQDALGLLEGGTTLQMEMEPTTMPGEGRLEWELEQMQLEQLANELETLFIEEGLEEQIMLEVEERGLVIRFLDHVLFDLGSASLRNEAQNILDSVAQLLEGLPNEFRSEGHTDDLPINTLRFPSNWELSAQRATTVVRYLAENHGLSPTRFAATGYGEYRPLAPNQPGGQPLNRRVDLVILRSTWNNGDPGWERSENIVFRREE